MASVSDDNHTAPYADVEYYRTILDLAPDGIIIHDEAGKITDANQTALDLFGYDSLPEIVGRPIRDLIRDANSCLRRDGSAFRADITIRTLPLPGPAATLYHIRGTTPSRKRDYLTTTRIRVLDSIIKGDPLTEIMDILVRAIEEDARCGAKVSVLLLNDDRLWCLAGPSLPPDYNRKLEGLEIGPKVGSCGTAAHLGKRVIVTDIENDPLWEASRELALGFGLRACWSEPILDANQRVIGTFATYYDEVREPTPGEIEVIEEFASLAGLAIERTRATARLRESEQRFRTLIEAIEEVIIIFDKRGRARYVSPASESITGYTPDERVGGSPFDLIHPSDLAVVRAEYERLVASPGSTARLESRIRHKDGSYRKISIHGHNLLEDPSIRGIVITYQDVTEQRRLEKRLGEAQKLEAIGRLAGGIAHEFNNLLNIMGGMTHLVLERPVDTKTRADLAEINNAVRKASRLTQQLLAFSKRQVVQPQTLAIDQLIEKTSTALRQLIGDTIELSTDLEADSHIRADPGQISQVLMNLAANARDAMPAGGTLSITTRRLTVEDSSLPQTLHSLESGEYLEISVADTGTGIEDGILPQIFEPFFTTKTEGGRSGLGLATVYGIVRQSRGSIIVDSKLGEGTTFRIYLPVLPDEEGPPLTLDSLASTTRYEKILVVEDSNALRMVVRRILASKDYQVIEAADGEEALKLVEEHRDTIDLILTDVIMPKMSGITMAKHLQETDPDLPIIYMSGYTDDQVIADKAGEGELHFLQKPFEPTELLRKVREVLG